MAQLVAAQYAQGLFELAEEAGQFAPVLDNLLRLKLVVNDRQCALLLCHPQIGANDKFDLLNNTLDSPVPEATQGFIRLLAEKGRLSILPEIIGEYIKLVDKRNNVTLGRVVSAERLDPAQLERIKVMLKDKFKKQIRLEEEIDPSVIAGFKVFVGDDLVDTSVKKRYC